MPLRPELVIGSSSGVGTATAPYLAKRGEAVDVTVPNDADASSGGS
ncbi:MAG: hypothetical protein U5K81_10285 [Trueperaceae bacterium]|nr:hypothetical protein [Trueperaceae bacterium]